MRRRHREALEEFNAKGYGELATFNSEVARGITHSEEYVAEMAAIQQRFNSEMLAKAEANGWIVVGGNAA